MHPGLPEGARKCRLPPARVTIDLEQLHNNWAALGHALRIGLLPTDTLDIHFARGGLAVPHLFGPEALRVFLKSARQWIERRGYRTACIWVLENRGDGSGLHAHVLIHIPPALSVRFQQLKPRWARKAGLNMTVPRVIKRKPLPTLDAVVGKLKYMSKDLDPKFLPMFSVAGRLHLHDNGKPSDQPVHGKKTGVSRNIDAKARADYRGRGQIRPGRLD